MMLVNKSSNLRYVIYKYEKPIAIIHHDYFGLSFQYCDSEIAAIMDSLNDVERHVKRICSNIKIPQYIIDKIDARILLQKLSER